MGLLPLTTVTANIEYGATKKWQITYALPDTTLWSMAMKKNTMEDQLWSVKFGPLVSRLNTVEGLLTI